MVTYLMIVFLNGKVLLSVPDIPNEKACYTLMEQVEGDLLPKRHWIYNLKCYRIE